MLIGYARVSTDDQNLDLKGVWKVLRLARGPMFDLSRDTEELTALLLDLTNGCCHRGPGRSHLRLPVLTPFQASEVPRARMMPHTPAFGANRAAQPCGLAWLYRVRAAAL